MRKRILAGLLCLFVLAASTVSAAPARIQTCVQPSPWKATMYQVIVSEDGGTVSGVTVTSAAIPRVGEIIAIEGVITGPVRSVTHTIAKVAGGAWQAVVTVRLEAQ